MSPWLVVVLSVLAGMFGLPLLNYGVWRLTIGRERIEAGATLLEFFSVWAGATLGAGTGAAIALERRGEPQAASWACAGSGLLVPTLVVLFISYWYLVDRRRSQAPRCWPPEPTRPSETRQEGLAFLLAVLGPTLCWVVGLLWAAIRLRVSARGA